MIPDPITWGHVLTLLALLPLLYALTQIVTWSSHRGHGYGTPGYARARDGRRFATWSVVLALILLAVGWLTPLAEAAVA